MLSLSSSWLLEVAGEAGLVTEENKNEGNKPKVSVGG